MVTLTWFIIGLEKGGERDTYKYMSWLPLLGLLLVWKKVERDIQMYVMITLTWFIIGLGKGGERDTYKYMSWLPLLGLLLVWEKVERDTYKCMS
jgi:hypothetical protein